jgi:hypothetical protein
MKEWGERPVEWHAAAAGESLHPELAAVDGIGFRAQGRIFFGVFFVFFPAKELNVRRCPRGPSGLPYLIAHAVGDVKVDGRRRKDRRLPGAAPDVAAVRADRQPCSPEF